MRSSASSTTWRRCRRAAATPGTCWTMPNAACWRSIPCVPRCPPRRRARRRRRAAPARRSRDATERRQAVDPELLTLFIEEAGEEIATIGRLFPLWAENPADRESLTRVRRAFHTLKGSGRVVGARRIGDFAWSVENLLNRVIDGTLERSSAMLATLREAIALLPSLVGELGGTSEEVAGLAELAAAHRIAHRGPGGARCKGSARGRIARADARAQGACARGRNQAHGSAARTAAAGTRTAGGRRLARPSCGLRRRRRLVAAGDLPEGSPEPPRGDPRLPAPRLARGRHAHGDRGSLSRLPHAARRVAHGGHPPQRPSRGAAAQMAAAHVRPRRALRRGGPRGAGGLRRRLRGRARWPCTRTPAISRTSTGWSSASSSRTPHSSSASPKSRRNLPCRRTSRWRRPAAAAAGAAAAGGAAASLARGAVARSRRRRSARARRARRAAEGAGHDRHRGQAALPGIRRAAAAAAPAEAAESCRIAQRRLRPGSRSRSSARRPTELLESADAALSDAQDVARRPRARDRAQARAAHAERRRAHGRHRGDGGPQPRARVARDPARRRTGPPRRPHPRGRAGEPR